MATPRVLVIRHDDRFSSLLREAGFEVLNLELIKTEPIENLNRLDEGLGRIDEYDGLFFTSPNSAGIFVQRMNRSSRKFGGKIYVLGRRAKKILEQAGFDVAGSESANTASELLSFFDESEFAGKRFLFVRGEKSIRAIPELLGRVADVDEVAVYRTTEKSPSQACVRKIRELLQRRGVDWICFFSPSGIERFVQLFSADVRDDLSVAAIGSTTAKKARETGMAVKFVSRKSNSEDFAWGLIKYLAARRADGVTLENIE